MFVYILYSSINACSVDCRSIKEVKKNGKIYKATPGGRRLAERESQLKQEEDQNLPN